MEVRIRRASEATARHLTTAEFGDLDKIIPTVKGWGLGDDEGRPLSGQIVIGAEGTKDAYFEIIIDDMAGEE